MQTITNLFSPALRSHEEKCPMSLDQGDISPTATALVISTSTLRAPGLPEPTDPILEEDEPEFNGRLIGELFQLDHIICDVLQCRDHYITQLPPDIVDVLSKLEDVYIEMFVCRTDAPTPEELLENERSRRFVESTLAQNVITRNPIRSSGINIRDNVLNVCITPPRNSLPRVDENLPRRSRLESKNPSLTPFSSPKPRVTLQ